MRSLKPPLHLHTGGNLGVTSKREATAETNHTFLLLGAPQCGQYEGIWSPRILLA